MKKSSIKLAKHLPRIACIVASLICLLLFPQEIGGGIKNGLYISGESIIPALFPFMVLSTYVSASPYAPYLSKKINKFSRRLFNISGTGLTAVILGILGGYPIGAKIIEEFFKSGMITQNDARRTLSWCVNPSPAFVITAIGSFMLNSYKSGIIMYISVLAATLSIGVASRFTYDKGTSEPTQAAALSLDRTNIFIYSVATASKSLLLICAWVVLFSSVCAGLNVITQNEAVLLFTQSIAEVTTGCKSAIQGNVSLPLICAILGFGGFAVIFQVAPYLQVCGYDLKLFICWRAVSGALSAFFCSALLKIFPDAQTAVQIVSIGNSEIAFSHSITASIILIITCIVLILEVDNKRKVW